MIRLTVYVYITLPKPLEAQEFLQVNRDFNSKCL
jgi:hypothetical protein